MNLDIKSIEESNDVMSSLAGASETIPKILRWKKGRQLIHQKKEKQKKIVK